MAWTEITYRCGHTGSVQLYGKADTREWKAKKIGEGVCPECQAKQDAAHDAECAAKNKEMGLPELQGTPKQIAWAESIRESAMRSMDSAFEKAQERAKKFRNLPEDEVKLNLRCLEECRDDILAKTSASWWIDHRSDVLSVWTAEAEDRAKKIKAGKPAEQVIVRPADAEQAEDGIVQVTLDPLNVFVEYPKNETLRKIMRQKGFFWNGVQWAKKKSPGSESLENLAADAVNALVRAGFSVQVREDVAKAVKSHLFTPVNRREVSLSKFGRFILTYEPNDELAKTLNSLPKAVEKESTEFEYRTDVKKFYAAEVAEAASVYGFAISTEAQEKIDEVLKASVEKVTPKEEPAPIPADAIFQHDGTEVIADLVDKD